MHRIALSVALLAALSVGLSLSVSAVRPAAASTAEWPEVVARVEGHEIHRKELETQAEILRGRMIQTGQPDPAEEPDFYHSVLEGLIGEVLVYADAKERGVVVAPEEVEAAIQRMEERVGDAAAFEQLLKAQGTDRAELGAQLERTLTIEKIIFSEVGSKVEVGPEMVREFYEENQDLLQTPKRLRMRHILVAPEGGGGSAARAQAEQLRVQLLEGADFAEVARQHSADEATAESGGEVGWIDETTASRIMGPGLRALEEADGPIVVETGGGFHVVELLEVKPAVQPDFEEVRPRIEEKLREMLVQREVQRRTARLHEDAKIEIFISDR